MTWEVVFNRPARRVLRKLPKTDIRRIEHALMEMEENPFAGDVIALKGVHQGSFRRRVGSWRIFFEIDNNLKRVVINNVHRGTSKTY